MRRYISLVSVLLVLTTASSAFAVVSVIIQQRHQNDALHSIICHGEHVARTTRFYTPVQRRRAIRFYEQSLEVAQLPPCPNS